MKILDSDFENFTTLPSESVYYGIFPYKLKIDAPVVQSNYFWLKSYTDFATDDEAASILKVTNFLHVMHSVIKGLQHQFRRRYDRLSGSYTLYLENYHDVVYVTETIPELIQSAHGPISDYHKQKLQSDTALSVDKQPYFGLYTHRYYFWYTFQDRMQMGLDRNANQDIASFFLDQEIEHSKLVKSFYGRFVTLYTDKHIMDALLPFMKLVVPGFRMKITERFIWPLH